jgi:hypothetical protein
MKGLTITQHRDPVARAALIACVFVLAWLAVTGTRQPLGRTWRV